MSSETSMGGRESAFPSTVWDDLSRNRRAPDTSVLDSIAARYWRPVYGFIRAVWKRPVEDAKDLTQEFFARVVDQDFLRAADPGRGRFRQFLLASLRNFLAGEHRRDQAALRGGGTVHFSLDAEDAEELADLRDPALTPEAAFDRAWAGEILRRAEVLLREDYEAAGQGRKFEVFRRYCLAGEEPSGTYADLARQLGLGENEVRHALVEARVRFRDQCRRIVRETVGTPDEVDDELVSLFGRWA